jgi:dihydroxyacetone kinase
MQRATGALRALPEGALVDSPAALAMAEALRRAIGGSSGPFYGTVLMRAARSLPPAPQAQDRARAYREAVAAIGALGGARPGDRTMLDALAPAANAFARSVEAGDGHCHVV